jgi:hypothetical protein
MIPWFEYSNLRDFWDIPYPSTEESNRSLVQIDNRGPHDEQNYKCDVAWYLDDIDWSWGPHVKRDSNQ